MSKPSLIISASGGRTSMFMSVWAHENLRDKYDIYFIFCNTGQEDDETLDFVRRVDDEFRLGVIWIEADVHHASRTGSTYKIVDYDSASRNGAPFEEVIKKYGIPNKAYPHCNRELKLNPMFAWRRDNCPAAKFAVGIRIDEIDRMSASAIKDGVVYPLISIKPTRKSDVMGWWRQHPGIDLRLPEHHGNCKTCWKKSDRKLMTIALEDASKFDFMDRMEREYATSGANDDARVFFRNKQSAMQLIETARRSVFEPFSQHVIASDLDRSDGCNSQCDMFSE